MDKTQLQQVKRLCKTNAKSLGVPLTRYYETLAKKCGFSSWARLTKKIDAGDIDLPDLKLPKIVDFYLRMPTPQEIVQDFINRYDQADNTEHCGHGVKAIEVLNAMYRRVCSLPGLLPLFEALDIRHPGGWLSKNYHQAYESLVSQHTPSVECSPYDSGEGGYLYPTVDVDDVIGEFFEEMDCPSVQELVMRLDEEGPWCENSFLFDMDTEDEES